MLVRATQMGYAGKDGHALRQPGEIFEIEDELVPGSTWLEPVDKPKRGRQATQDGQEDTLV